MGGDSLGKSSFCPPSFRSPPKSAKTLGLDCLRYASENGGWPLPMPDPAALGPLLAAVFGPVPSKRRVMLRLRPGPC
jgi:hypothetical protein